MVHIRLPADLKEKIEAAADSGKRSMNAEIVARLEQSFGPRKGLQLSFPEGSVDYLAGGSINLVIAEAPEGGLMILPAEVAKKQPGAK